jgi:hypothetical protein
LTLALVIPANSIGNVLFRIAEVQEGWVPPGDGLTEEGNHFLESTDLHPVFGAIKIMTSSGKLGVGVMNTLPEPSWNKVRVYPPNYEKQDKNKEKLSHA